MYDESLHVRHGMNTGRHRITKPVTKSDGMVQKKWHIMTGGGK